MLKKLNSKFLVLVIILSASIGCSKQSNDSQSKNEQPTIKSEINSTLLSASSSHFGELNGEPVTLFTLTNNNGISVKIMDLGATITSIITPDSQGNSANITAGFDTLESYLSTEYKENNPYFGGIVGRYASVINEAKFSLNNINYPLGKNMGPHHLHGGIIGFDKKLWKGTLIEKGDYVALQLNLKSVDGEEGYPGNLNISVEYRLNNNNEIQIHYLADTDKSTPLSLTNHAYFNLNGFTENILNHQLQLNSDSYLQPNKNGVIDGNITKVKNTVTDFNKSKKIRTAFSELPNGFEHFYVFDNTEAKLNKVATVSDEKSGRSLEVFTTEPGALFYTGRYTSDKLAREDGTRYGQFKALCIETSKYPNGPNIMGSPRTILSPDKKYKETTIYKFSW